MKRKVYDTVARNRPNESSDDSEADWENLSVHDDEDEKEFQARVDERRIQNQLARRRRHEEREREEYEYEQQERKEREERERKEAVKRKVYDTARNPPSKRPRSGGGCNSGDKGNGPRGCVVM